MPEGCGKAPPAGLDPLDAVLDQVAVYYQAKLIRHGANPRGVDWSCAATQCLRFVQLLKLCSFDGPFSLIDLGCGYGALARFLRTRYPHAQVDYTGIDICAAMIRRAKRSQSTDPGIQFLVGRSCPWQADYAVASGIMNVTLGCPRPLWEEVVKSTLADLRRMSRRGFSVNFLAAVPDGAPPEMLYCADPAVWAAFCQSTLGCSVHILGDYGMKEFTILAKH